MFMAAWPSFGCGRYVPKSRLTVPEKRRLRRSGLHSIASMAEAPHEKGGLGLARIRFEAELELEVAVHGDRVTVHATGPLAARRAA